MSSLIVIRIVPPQPLAPGEFTKYLNPALGPLQITAFELSFSDPSVGRNLGTAKYVAASTGPSPTSAQTMPPTPALKSPKYNPASPATAIVQHYDVNPPVPPSDSAYFQLDAAATAVIEIPAAAKIENLRLVAQWGSGAGATPVPVDQLYYDVQLSAGPSPDLNAWAPSPSPTSLDEPQIDPWMALPPSAYLHLPAPPSSAKPFSFSLPTDGTPPSFDELLAAVQQILSLDPGASPVIATTAAALAGDSTLKIPPGTLGIAPGMSVSGAAGIAAGTTVSSIDASGLVTLSQEVVPPGVPSGTNITFSPNLGALSAEQCRNIAREIVWSQQPPPPQPPESVGQLYSNPPNAGAMLNGTTPNQLEADRQQLEASLLSYYALADAKADRLTGFVHALSAAISCEQRSLTSTQAMLELPANSAAAGGGPVSGHQIILTGVDSVDPPSNFGVPAAYFYGLAALLPLEIGADRRFQLASGDHIERLLSELTTAIEAGTITDSEAFVALAPQAINAAQAARRIAALGIPISSSVPLSPLGARRLQTLSDTPSGTKLTFASTDGLKVGMLVSGINVPINTTIAALTPTVVTLTSPLQGHIAVGSTIYFVPPYSAGIVTLVKSWLAFPPSTTGTPSSQAYLAADDAAKFWPIAKSAQSDAYLNLVLSALTEGFIVPAPFNTALGDLIIDNLLQPTPSVEALAAVTRAQWIDFFQKHPTWLPPGTGNIQARIDAFIRRAQSFLVIGGGGPIASFVLATLSPTALGSTTIEFAPSPQIAVDMLVSDTSIPPGSAIPPGTTVKAVVTAGGKTTVTLSTAVTAVIPINSNITFSMNVSTGSAPHLPQLAAPAQDWLTLCLVAYGPFTLGTGFDPAKLRAAAATVFADDKSAQGWVFDALTTLDALYQVMKPVPLPAPGTPALEFSIIEALYARGFTSAQTITAISGDQFQEALTGTVAFELAAQIYTSASALAPPTPDGALPHGFVPVNADGSLTNCVPSPCTSPFGPIAYLSELLKLSELSTCDVPFAGTQSLQTNDDTPAGQTLTFVSSTGVISGMSVSGPNIPDDTVVTNVTPTSVTLNQAASADIPNGSIITFTPRTLQTVLNKRRGPLGDLSASCANLETPLPLIDIVNENLEYLGVAAAPTNGTVYDTSADKLADHLLCRDEPCPPDECAPFCHKPARIFGALPEYSTPATPVAANSGVEPAVFNILKKDFSACRLPYSQALDVSRTYLRHFGSCRVEEMRTFRKCITEFVLDPANEPVGFQDHLWRFPLRIDIAIEYLGITPEEYTTLFRGTEVTTCGARAEQPRDPDGDDPARPRLDDQNNLDNPIIRDRTLGPPVWALYGFAERGDNDNWIDIVSNLPEFLARTCLSYCEFYELWQSGFVKFANRARQDGAFPECEPCCLDNLTLQFPEQRRGRASALVQLIVFIRLWRKLKDSCCFCYSFAQLRDICNVLHLFDDSGAINPEFIRQLAAFQMLRDQFCLDLFSKSEKPAPTAVDEDRTQILSLWVGPAATKWGWAVRQLCEKVLHHAKLRYRCEHHRPDLVEWLLSKLDPLSRLAGFDPASAINNWHALPTHTLRFAEILAKLSASRFTLAEVLYLFTVDDQHCGDIFPLPDECEASELPLALPADECGFSLWHLRRKLLCSPAPELAPDSSWRISVAVDSIQPAEGCAPCDEPRKAVHVEATISEECTDDWDWQRVSKILTDELGFMLDDVLDLGRHLFPQLLKKSGFVVDVATTRFITSLPAAKTTAAMWSANADGPLQYDAASEKLWTHIPLADESLISQLVRLNSLNSDEQSAVQDLYFQPRALLALFAVLFPDFARAERHLIETRDECERWDYFRRHVAQCHQRCRIIACHLAAHVAAVTKQPCPDGESVALLILRELFGDENAATSDWEKDDGTEPAVMWTPRPNGSGFAALLGLLGTGLVTEYKADGGGLVWRNVTGALDGFGPLHDRVNAPILTVLPSLGATITPAQSKYVSVRNGFLVKNAGGAMLGGAQGFEATWSGALLVDEEGQYEFWAGAPRPGHEKPDCGCETVDRFKWRVTLKRGSRTWVILSHRWPAEDERHAACRHLRSGAYEITVEFIRPAFEFATEEQVHALHAGLEVKYSGPDSCGECIPIPRRQLFTMLKDAPLVQGIATQSASATLFLQRYYSSSFRDIRRTYQRAFKALLFAHRFALSAERNCHGTSELSYMLEEKERFAGASYFSAGSAFVRHAANFDFNFLPLLDDYNPPAADSRTKPSAKRTQAMFDWWERTFDYTVARDDVYSRHYRELWHLFAEARATNPADPAPLMAYIGADPRFWKLELRYFQNHFAPPYAVSSDDLKDDRWTVRAWHAGRWLAGLDQHFAAKDITVARPDLWASDDPSALLPGETQTGNANLSAFLCDGCLEHGNPLRYDDLRRLNDGLRQRGRDALVAYLCHDNRVALPWAPGQFVTQPRELSELLLLDVEAGICEKATRIEDAISVCHCFIRRSRLLLEPGWTVTREFAELWDRQFATLEIWQACKRRTFYKENWVDWSDLKKAQGVEAFRFLEDKLRSAKLTVAVPGGTEWWPEKLPSAQEPPALQRREPSSIHALEAPREGLNLLGTPERDARSSWLAAVHGEVRRNPVLANVGSKPLPLWMEAAINVGTKFLRIAAAGVPPASSAFEPHTRNEADDCVACCHECGCSHPALIDEYFFWLIPAEIYEPPAPAALSGASGGSTTTDYENGFQDDYYDAVQQQSAVWHETDKVPRLLDWPSKPAVRLAWCRIHNGEFQQPRRSIRALQVAPAADSDLVFLGRMADSLTFSVSNGIAPEGYLDPADPGFRFDLAEDDAIVLPQLLIPKPTLPTFLGSANLPAYPWMLFVSPGKPLFPLSPFTPALAVAQALRSHCRFEAALAWYRSAFNPLAEDCTWIDCYPDDDGNDDGDRGDGNNDNDGNRGDGHPRISGIRGRVPREACCDSTDISCEQARTRSILLHYLETLVEWGDAVRRHRHSAEAEQDALTIFESAAKILGRMPRTVTLPDPTSVPKVSAFLPQFPPLNPRLLNVYEVVRDRLESIRVCSNDRRLRDGRRKVEADYFGDSPLREGWRNSITPCDEEAEWCFLRSPYRFSFLIQKAHEYASRVQELGNALLGAFEKGDAEFLASFRAGHERELLTLGLESRKNAWRDADWQIESLQKTKAMNQANLQYYTDLKAHGLISGEIMYQTLTAASMLLRTGSNAIEVVGGAMNSAGNYFLGVAGFGGTPLKYAQLPIGEPLAGGFYSAARVLVALSDIASTTAGLELTESGWDRRLADWTHQIDVLAIEIQQIERQILGAQRRRDQTLNDLNIQQRQLEHSPEVQNFLRDKFTAHDLYLYLQKETAALHCKTYELALAAALQAQHAFNVERGHTTRKFIPECEWGSLHEGLMAGDRLSAALRQMEKAYLDENVREYELTKQISLRLHFPAEFLQLRTTGRCEIEIPEWMFDMDFPGHYMRRIKSVSLTIPCVTGPYTGVHCRLTLLGSTIRVDPRLSTPIHECCCPKGCCDSCDDVVRLAHEYTPCPDDPRIVRQFGAREAVATSTGQNDTGLFTLDFNDQRYLPFEYAGAVSRWCIELPAENNYFDTSTQTDCIVRLGITAREGGPLLRRAAEAAARGRLPGDGWRLIDVRHEFPDAWERFKNCVGHDTNNHIDLCFERRMFPFVPGGQEIIIGGMAILLGKHMHHHLGCECECEYPRTHWCPCPEHPELTRAIVEFLHSEVDCADSIRVECIANEAWPDFLFGTVKAMIGPIADKDRRGLVQLRFSPSAKHLEQLFLLCRYAPISASGCGCDSNERT
jgi:hypothetical protein